MNRKIKTNKSIFGSSGSVFRQGLVLPITPEVTLGLFFLIKVTKFRRSRLIKVLKAYRQRLQKCNAQTAIA
jgi:hypothetical protein